MRFHLLPFAAADRGALRLAALCLGGLAIASAALAFTDIFPAKAQSSAQSPSTSTITPFVVLPTVPQASDVLPASPNRDEPEIATHGG